MSNDNYTAAIDNIRNEMILEARSYADENRDVNNVEIEYTKLSTGLIYITFDGENINNTFDVVYEDGERVSKQLYKEVKEIAFEFVNEYRCELSDQESNEQHDDNIKSLNTQYQNDKL